MAELVAVDSEGRVRLPQRILRRLRGRLLEVEVRGDEIILRPVNPPKLEELLDSVEVDVDPEAFTDYSRLRKLLLSGADGG